MEKGLREQFTKETGCDFFRHSHTYIEWLEGKLADAYVIIENLQDLRPEN